MNRFKCMERDRSIIPFLYKYKTLVCILYVVSIVILYIHLPTYLLPRQSHTVVRRCFWYNFPKNVMVKCTIFHHSANQNQPSSLCKWIFCILRRRRGQSSFSRRFCGIIVKQNLLEEVGNSDGNLWLRIQVKTI